MIVPVLCVAVQSSNESSSLAMRGPKEGNGVGGSHSGKYSIVNQAALTTLSRLSLSLGYHTGQEFLR
jgi:hypothetical protein